jgi:hypothetical protein
LEIGNSEGKAYRAPFPTLGLTLFGKVFTMNVGYELNIT